MLKQQRGNLKMLKLFRKAAIALLLMLAAGAVFSAEAAFVPNPDARPERKVNTVEEVKAFPDDARIVLRGHIMDHIRSDHYTFQDETGAIAVEIEDDEWHGLTVSPSDRVEIHGEVDRDRTRMEIEVDYIRILD
jgi:uncharacterized protein (TIGR00156 family)